MNFVNAFKLVAVLTVSLTMHFAVSLGRVSMCLSKNTNRSGINVGSIDLSPVWHGNLLVS